MEFCAVLSSYTALGEKVNIFGSIVLDKICIKTLIMHNQSMKSLIIYVKWLAEFSKISHRQRDLSIFVRK